MRATKLLWVSVTLWAVVVGADRANAGGVNLNMPRVSVPTNSLRTNTPTTSLNRQMNTDAKLINRSAETEASRLGQFYFINHNNNGGGTTVFNTPSGSGAQGRHHYSGGGAFGPHRSGSDAEADSGGARPARYYAPPVAYNSKTACGRYPYPACK